MEFRASEVGGQAGKNYLHVARQSKNAPMLAMPIAGTAMSIEWADKKLS